MRRIIVITITALILAGCATAPGSLRASIDIDTTPAPTVAALLEIQATAAPVPTFTPTPAPLVLAVRQGETWNMRREASETASIVAVLAGGERCEILAKDASEWLWVACSGRVGYVHRDAFAPGEVTP